jgi:hypothetical protein
MAAQFLLTRFVIGDCDFLLAHRKGDRRPYVAKKAACASLLSQFGYEPVAVRLGHEGSRRWSNEVLIATSPARVVKLEHLEQDLPARRHFRKEIVFDGSVASIPRPE